MIRIFEYDAQIALDQNGKLVGNRIIVRFPNTGVLYLRSTQTTPGELEVVIQTPGGAVSYFVPCIKVISYSIEEIFEKKLFFLLPFHVFSYEKRFPEIEEQEEQLKKMRVEYEQIRDKLEQICKNGTIDGFTGKTLMDMSQRILVNLARNYQKIREGVGSVMVGQVLDYEAKRILNQGWRKGQEEGMMDTLNEMVRKKRLSLQEAAEMAGMTEKEFCSWKSEFMKKK